jgi:putative redox protein
MSSTTTKAIVKFVEDDLFVGVSPSGHSLTLDTNHERSLAASPVELLLVALGSCTAVDVISILKKRRQIVTGYQVEISGTRRDDYPRSYKTMTVHHVLRGKSISAKAAEQAIELSETKYCSVAATFRPTVEIHSTFEIIEDDSEGNQE